MEKIERVLREKSPGGWILDGLHLIPSTSLLDQSIFSFIRNHEVFHDALIVLQASSIGTSSPELFWTDVTTTAERPSREGAFVTHGRSVAVNIPRISAMFMFPTCGQERKAKRD